MILLLILIIIIVLIAIIYYKSGGSGEPIFFASLFFNTYDQDILDSVKFTGNAMYSITKYADNLTIIDKIKKIGSYDIVTIAFTCVGCDSIAFSDHFKQINAIELSKSNYECLIYNIKLMKKKNIKTYNTDYLKCLDFKQDVVYFDPPWGMNYRDTNLRIKIGNMYIDEFMKKVKAKLYIYKIPFNYDMRTLTRFGKQMQLLPFKKFLIAFFF